MCHTEYAKYTDAKDVWVRGDAVAVIAADRDEARDLLRMVRRMATLPPACEAKIDAFLARATGKETAV